MKRCMVVDDSKVIRQVARHLLETLDYEVSEAADGQQALDLLEGGAPDVILLDWNMPVMDGMQFLQALNQRSFEPRPKVVFCTTENGTDQIRNALNAGADEYIMKPFDRDTLQGKLEAIGLD